MTSFKKYFSLTALMMALVSFTMAQDIKIANFRAPDQSGINVFETPKDDVKFDGLKVRVGGNFTQQFQALNHSNSPILDSGIVINGLSYITPGFNLATANLNIDAQLADGIRLRLVTYLSSRHHVEAWVKGGYIQFDKLPFNSDVVDEIMQYVTIKVGHMEINYGDAHFRRSDNGNAIYNPFVGNYIMDAFTTEIGGEIYFQKDGLIAMVGITNGELKGNITAGTVKDEDGTVMQEGTLAPAFLGKIGYDAEVAEDLRVRLTASIYQTNSSVTTRVFDGNHLYNGDRTGSRYYGVLDAGDFSGRFNPNLKSRTTAIMINPFIKFKGLEVFGVIENATGGTQAEVDAFKDNIGDLRRWNQVGGEVIYRFFENESLFVGGRYNLVSQGGDVISPQSIERYQVGAGWFLTPNVLLKGEYVNQTYTNFTGTLNDGNFNGLMIEAVVGF